MRTIRLLYHMARADLFERLRRYSFLITLGLVVFLGYQVNIGNAALYLNQYRGIFNSAWVGSMLTVVGTFFLGWFGFYLVKGSITRDYETGVGQIIATTPIHRAQYMLGKWLSNLTVLMLMMSLLAGAGMIMQLFQREDPHLDLWALLSPFLLVGLPAMALVAAFATLFDTIRWLRGGLGNVLYFFLFTFTPFLAFENVAIPAALEPLGLKVILHRYGRRGPPGFSRLYGWVLDRFDGSGGRRHVCLAGRGLDGRHHLLAGGSYRNLPGDRPAGCPVFRPLRYFHVTQAAVREKAATPRTHSGGGSSRFANSTR